MNTSEIIDGQWYEVLRPDGTKQYAQGYVSEDGSKSGWLLWGSGFVINKLVAISITPYNGIPENEKHGIAHFDGMVEHRYKAVCNTNSRWNGWYRPFIHVDDIERLCKDLTQEEYQLEFTTNKRVKISEVVADVVHHEEIIEPTVINGENYYYMGNGGWCFQFAPYDDQEGMDMLKSTEEEE